VSGESERYLQLLGFALLALLLTAILVKLPTLANCMM
jgi:hypothetical protein